MASSYPSHPLLKSLAEQAGFDHPVKALFCVPIRYEPRVLNITEKPIKELYVPYVFTGVISDHPQQISINPPTYCVFSKGPNRFENIQLNFNGILDKANPVSHWTTGTEFSVVGVAQKEKLIFCVVTDDVDMPFAIYKGKGRGTNKLLPRLINQAFAPNIGQAIEQVKILFDTTQEHPILEFLNHQLDPSDAFTSLRKFFHSLHFPPNFHVAEVAKQAAANLAATDCCFRAQRASRRDRLPDAIIPIPRELVVSLIARIPFSPTAEQRAAMKDIWNDIKSDLPMYRLLSGDVGTGKTVVYAVIAAASQLIGKKVVIFTPNAALVHQVFNEFSSWFPEIPLFRVTSEEKHDPSILKDNPILIGTQAVLNWCKTNQHTPDFMVVDEQQKISRSQRESLMEKHTNFLEATATCIPRTYALLLYGGMKVSVIRKQPVEKMITTKLVFEENKPIVNDHIKLEISNHSKVAVILPLVNKKESDEVDPNADKLAVETALKGWEKSFPRMVLGLHGKMPESDKIARLKSINEDDSKGIIVATSLIEIGVTIRNLRLLLIVEPDRYGVNSLHQMRGRLARNGGHGIVYLLLKKLPDDVADKTLKRLRLLEEINDGFALAEADAQIRGWGDLAEDSEIQKGAVVTLFTHILIPQTVISSIQTFFEEKLGKLSQF
jgi:RecG-like helicase